MKHTNWIFIASTALLLTACDGSTSSAAIGGVKGDISQDRTAAFKSFMPTFSNIGKMVNGDEAFDAIKFQKLAAQFKDEARVPFESFQNDPQGNGDALPNIWAKPAEFKAEQDKFFAAIDKLNTAAQTGQLNSIKAAHSEVNASCKSCHQTYRRPK